MSSCLFVSSTIVCLNCSIRLLLSISRVPTYTHLSDTVFISFRHASWRVIIDRITHGAITSSVIGSLANTIQIQILCLIITNTDTPILQAHERTVDSRAAVSGPVCRGWRDGDVYRCRYLEVNGRSAGGSSASLCRIGEGRGGGKTLLLSNRR